MRLDPPTRSDETDARKPSVRCFHLSRFIAGLAAFALLTGNVGVTARRARSLNRYWEDMSVAIKLYLDGRFPDASALNARNPYRGAAICKRIVISWVIEQGVQPREPWRTMDPQLFVAERSQLAPALPWEDKGRAMALAAGFRLLGGVSPYLILWLGVLASFPIFLWTSWEFFDARRGVAATVFLLLFASSPYVTDCLWWGHSAVGFYLIALAALAGFSAYAVLGHRTSHAGFFLRSLMAGTAFAVCAVCRGDTLLLFPGFLVALAWACSRVFPRSANSDRSLFPEFIRRAVSCGRLFVAGLALFWLPFVLMRQPQTRNFWTGMWEGLGDFDRTKGHSWRDADAIKALHAANLAREMDEDAPWRRLHKFINDDAEDFFRRSVLQDIREDPRWYVTILGKRVLATVVQDKLWPWGPRDGRSVEPQTGPSQGDTDGYYGATATADFLALGSRRKELPMLLVVTPTLLLLLAWAGSTWLAKGPPLGERLMGDLKVLSCLGVGALALPVLMTTAAAQETQAFILVYFLGFAFLIDELARLAILKPNTGLRLGAA